MPLDIQSYYEVHVSRVLISKKFSKKFNEKQEILDKKGKLIVKIVKKGNVNDLKEILEESTTGLRYDNDYSLIFSCMNGYYHLVKVLVQHGYLKLNLKLKLSEVFAYSIEWSAKMGHLKILQFLLDTLKSCNELCNVKSLLEKMLLKNYNYDRTYINMLDDNLINITKSKEIVKKNNEFNKFNKRNRNANISIFDEMLIDASNETDLGVDYNENELDQEEIEDEIINDDIDIDDELEPDQEEIDPEEKEDNDEHDLFGSDNESDIESETESKNKKQTKKYNSLCFKKFKKNNVYFDGEKSNKSNRMEVILWLLSQEYIINTNYYFISRYIVKYKMENIINILKKHNKFMLHPENLNFNELNLN
jgi:hypothetical protein